MPVPTTESSQWLPPRSVSLLPSLPSVRLQKRESGKADWRALMAAGIIIAVFLLVALFCFFKIRSVRNRQHLSPSSKQRANDPSWLTRKWNQLNPLTRHKYSSRLQDDAESSLSGRAGNDPNGSNNNNREMSAVDPSGIETDPSGVDRHTSVRSIMTLPAYAPTARENERILAREGERAGIDVVVEFPESDNEEETRRNEEMESLYQIRVARRAEQAEREDRRRRRREARERGDMETLSRLRRESRMHRGGGGANGPLSSAQLIAEHQAQVQARERRVSSVQYAALGVQRHDGTRLRANSTEDDNRPLLEGAASMADTNTTTNNSAGAAPSPVPSAPGPVGRGMMHHRDFSATSIMSNETTASEDAWTSAQQQQQQQQQQQAQRNPSHDSSINSNTTDFEVIRLTNSRSRSPPGSRLTPAVTVDSSRPPRLSSDSRAPRHSTDSRMRSSSELVGGPAPPEPPLYEELVGGWEEAPPYTSPVEGRAPVLPSIQVSEGLGSGEVEEVVEATGADGSKKGDEEGERSSSGDGTGEGRGEESATATATVTAAGSGEGR